jgi:hypothetical protein
MRRQVTCEEIVTEEDLFEIRGIHWQEQDGLHTSYDSETILEEIEGLESMTHYPEALTDDNNLGLERGDQTRSYDMDDETDSDAGSEIGEADEKMEYCVGSSWESRQPPSVEEAR